MPYLMDDFVEDSRRTWERAQNESEHKRLELRLKVEFCVIVALGLVSLGLYVAGKLGLL